MVYIVVRPILNSWICCQRWWSQHQINYTNQFVSKLKLSLENTHCFAFCQNRQIITSLELSIMVIVFQHNYYGLQGTPVTLYTRVNV